SRPQHGNQHVFFADQQDTGQNEGGGGAIKQQHGVLLGEPALEEFVMNVVRVSPKERLLSEEPPNYRESDVNDRQAEAQQGKGHAHYRRSSRPAAQRKRTESKTDKQASRIAHENAGRLEVEGHKPE